MKSFWLASACVLAFPFAATAQTTTAPGAAGTAGPAAAAPAGPATASPATSAAAATADVNEIIVTATKRSQVLSDVPIAVSAVSAAQLQNSGGSDIRQLNQLAPSLLVSSATNESSAVARIRGIGTVGENPGLESSVAVFIDGVYRSRTGVGLSELGAIERIEVLRGPQGTLFGRNASAGLINIVTAQPSFNTQGYAEGSYGNYNYYKLQGGITGAVLGDKIAARIDGVYNKRDGFLKDVISGRTLANRNRYLVRGQLLLKPTDDIRIRLIGDYNQKNEECCGAVYLAPAQNLTRNAAGDMVSSPNSIAALITRLGGTVVLPEGTAKFTRRTALTPGTDYHQRSKDYGASGQLDWDLGGAALTSISAYRVYDSNNGQDSDFSSLDLLKRDDQNRKFETFSQELRLQGQLFNDRLDFLIGGYYANEKLTVRDNIKYGADFERYYNAQFAGFLPNALQTFAGAVGYVPPAGQSLLNGTGVVLDTFRQSSRNYAFFTHNVLSIVPDKLLLTVGARYTNERKTLDTSFNHNNNFCNALRNAPAFVAPDPRAGLNGLRPAITSVACIINGTSGPGFSPATDPNARKSESRVTGTAVLSYKPVDQLLVYGSYSRGYKAGGFNLDTSALDAANAAIAAGTPLNTRNNGRPDAADLRFEPELVTAYEVGAKLDLREFKLNAALFYQGFNQFQLNTFNGVNFEVANIVSCANDLAGADTDLSAATGACTGKARKGVVSKGVEIEAFIYPADDVTFTLGGTYADTRYQKNLTGIGGAPLAPTLFQLPGRRFSNAAAYVVTGSAAWSPKLSNGMSTLLYADFRYQSDINTGSDLDFEKQQDGFIVVNARVGLYGAEKRFGVELWAQNLLNETYQQVAADAPLQGSGTFRQTAKFGSTANQLYISFPSEPRTYGITVRTKF